MKTVYYTASTLDGFLADLDDRLDWLMQFGDGPPEDYAAFIAQVGAIAMGSTTYRWILDHDPGAWPYAVPAWVFTTRTLPAVPGADVRFVRGDVEPVHREMAAVASGKNVWIAGGGDLVGQFHDRGLLDEIVVTVAPVTLGAGAPLLPRRITTPPLRLLSCRVYATVFAQLTYEVPKPGGSRS